MSCLNAVKVVRQSPPLLLMIMCPRGGTRARPHPGKSITPPTQAVVRRRYPSLSLPLPPDTLPQRQQPAAGTHRHKAHAAHRAQLHKHCAKVTRAPQKHGQFISRVQTPSAVVYSPPTRGAKHGPTGVEGSINRQIYGDLGTPYCVVTFTWKYISHHKVHLHRQIYGDLRTLYCAVTFTLMYNSYLYVIVRIICSRECHC